jgi:hypothetical protein
MVVQPWRGLPVFCAATKLLHNIGAETRRLAVNFGISGLVAEYGLRINQFLLSSQNSRWKPVSKFSAPKSSVDYFIT